MAQQFRRLYARYQQERDLINVGAYAPGSDPDTDQAIALMPHMHNYLRQGFGERVDLASALGELHKLFEAANSPEDVAAMQPAVSM